ncbi:hypothetical protein FKM82_028312 [Ascaphus truei]
MEAVWIFCTAGAIHELEYSLTIQLLSPLPGQRPFQTLTLVWVCNRAFDLGTQCSPLQICSPPLPFVCGSHHYTSPQISHVRFEALMGDFMTNIKPFLKKTLFTQDEGIHQ